MPKLSVWKIKRELDRMFQQFRAFCMRPIYLVKQSAHDRTKEKHTTITPGHLPLCSAVVIFVIYQPNGLSRSVFHTLKHIISEGFSPFVVLNSPITGREFDELRAQSAMVMERPNFGYDFGGYRDAMMYISALEHKLDCVGFLNDSIWYPVFDSCDHLKLMKALDGDLIGYSCSKTFEPLTKQHLDSYFFMFKGSKFLRSKQVTDFWTSLRVASNRYFTIRNSEMKMTKYFSDLGFKVNWLFSEKDLLNTLDNWTDIAIYDFVDYLVSIGHKKSKELSAIRGMEASVIKERIGILLRSGSISRNNIGNAPLALYVHAGFAAMKKSKSYNYKVQRQRTVASDNGVHFNLTIFSEVAASVEQESPYGERR